MTYLTQEEYKNFLDTHLSRMGQTNLLETGFHQAPSTSKRKHDALHTRLQRRLLSYIGRLELLVKNTNTLEYWIPDTKAPTLRLADTTQHGDVKFDIAVHMHVYFLDLLPELLYQTQNIGQAFTCYITTDSEKKAAAIRVLFTKHPLISSFKVIVTPNRGRDIAPWVIEMKPYSNLHELWCHIHTKRSVHARNLGDKWRKFLLTQIIGSKHSVQQILSAFKIDSDLGIVIPPFFSQAVYRPFNEWDDYIEAKKFLESLGVKQIPLRRPVFSAGSMSWYRPEALSSLFLKGFTYEDFEQETNQVGGTLAHLIERSLVYISKSSSFGFKVIIPTEKHLPT